MSNMMYGYARVSTRSQKEDRQVVALQEFGVALDCIIIEKQSGKNFDRPLYRKLVQTLRPGDVLAVKSIDRLGRNYEEILEQWAHITKTREAAGIENGGRISASVSDDREVSFEFVRQFGINHCLHHSRRKTGLGHTPDLVLVILRGKTLRPAFTAKEHGPFAEYRQAADLDGTGSAHKGVGGDAVKIPHIHGIESPVKGDRLHIDVRVQQLGGSGLDGLSPVDHLLGTTGGVNAQILDAVLIPARVKDLSCVYAHGLPDTAIVTDGAGHDLFWHRIPS